MKRLVTGFLWLVAVVAALRAAAAAGERRFEAGSRSADADDVRLAAFWGGTDFRSRATALRSLQAKTVLGGMNLDLRAAQIHPEGASISIEVIAGGVNLEIPSGWRVEVDERLRAGEVAAHLPDPANLPPSAPLLAVAITGTAGGVNIQAAPE